MAKRVIYLVVLPEQLDVEGYGDIEKIGITIAGSAQKAVTNLLFRQLIDKDKARIIADKLNGRGGLENFATDVKDIERVPVVRKDGKSDTWEERRAFVNAYELTYGIKRIVGSRLGDVDCYDLARDVLRGR